MNWILNDLLQARASEAPDREVYRFLADGEVDDAVLTFGELDRQARTLAAALQERLEPGDRVLLLLPSGPEFIAAFFGCLYAGAVAVPAYPPRSNRPQPRLEAIVRDARPRVALTTAAMLRRVEALAARVPELAGLQCLALESLLGADPESWRRPKAGPDTLAFLQYTSGSTATPKGVMVSHGNLLHNEEVIRQAFGQSESSVVVGWLPLHHDMGLIGNVLQPLYVGARCVLMSPTAFLQRPARWLAAISRYGGTTSGGPNFAYDLCVSKISPADRAELDLSSWAVAFNGAEPVRAATLDRFAEAFAPAGFRREAFLPCYGLAESTLLVTGGPRQGMPVVQPFDEAALEKDAASPVAEGAGRLLVGNGRPGGGQRVEIVDAESGMPVPAGRVGEIWVSGPSVAQGYWNQAEESERTFGARLTGSGEGPFLRTGDLGFLHDGELFVTGRLKDLIILRGRNLYPQDIEATAEASHRLLVHGGAAAFSIEVSGEERLVVVHEVERRAEADLDAEEIIAALRQAVADEHEVDVWGVALLRAGSLPRTSSGKVQRQLCRKHYLEGLLTEVGRSAVRDEGEPAFAGLPLDRSSLAGLPGSERHRALEEHLAVEIARLARVSPGRLKREPWTRLSLDSLAAIELKHGLETRFQVSLGLRDLLEDGTIAGLATEILARIDGAEGAPEEEFPRRPALPDGEHPLSYGQEALWIEQRLSPGSPVYNLAGAARVLSPVDPDALRRAFETLAQRHGALRSVFREDRGTPVCATLPEAAVDFAVEDASAWSEERLREEAERPFDLARGPLLRVRLFGRQDVPVLLVVVHHLVADFWSVALLGRELGLLLEPLASEATLPRPAFGYGDHVAWQRERLAGRRGEALASYWRARLNGEPPTFDLPADRPRPARPSHRAVAASISFDPAVTAALQRLGRERGATLFVTLLAGFQALLYRLTGEEEVRVGTPTSGRGRPELAEVVGYFVNPVVLRAEVSGRLLFETHLAQVRGTALEAFEHQDYPLGLLASAEAPLFQAVLALQRSHVPGLEPLSAFALGQEGVRVELGGLVLESLGLAPRWTEFDLTVMAAERQGSLRATLLAAVDRFDAGTAQRLARQLETLLKGAAADPLQAIGDLPLLDESERAQLLVGWNETAVDLSGEESVTERVARRALETPEALAVADGRERISYAELVSRASRLARFLEESGAGPEHPVAVCLPRSVDLVTALLGVLWTGAPYVALDPSHPDERLAFAVASSGASVLLGRRGRLESLPGLGARAVALDGSDAWPREPGGPPGPALPASLAYIIYTSGSTGTPKGVEVPHAGLLNLVLWHQRTYGVIPEDRVAQVASPAFDASVWEIWSCLASGASLHVLDDEVRASPGALARWLAAESITLTFLPTPLAEAVLAEPWEGSRLRALLTGGDRLALRPPPSAPFALFNHYGPTEGSVVATAGRVDPFGNQPPSIGRPIANVRTYVLDREGLPVPRGAIGELCLGGVGLARGYGGDAPRTAERFVPDPFGEPGSRLYRTGDFARHRTDGRLDFLGRVDAQVKIRGFRIEPGEIESALVSHPAVRAAAVVAREDRRGRRRLVAYVVPDGEPGPDAEKLRAYLRRSLPEYQVPSAFVLLSALPLATSGKVDRRALPELAEASEGAAPRTPVEELVAAIWADLLGVERVGPEDSFFELGGHSLMAARVTARLREVFGVELPVRALFEAPTLADLAAAVEAAQGAGRGPAAPPIGPAPRDGRLPLSFAQERLWFLEQLEPGLAVYNVPVVVRLAGRLRVSLLQAALAAVARRQEALRTTFDAVDGEPFLVIRPELDLTLSIVDIEGRAEELGRLAREEAARPFDLKRGPLLRAMLVRLGEQEHALLLTLHHLVSDGWSMGVLVREIAAFYGAAPLPELPVQYADFAAWQRRWLAGDALDGQLAYWQERLAGAPTTLDLPTDRPRPPAQTYRGARCPLRLPDGVSAGVRALALREGVTVSMVLLSAFQVLLGRYSRQEDLLVGMPMANRNRIEIEPLVGLFVNTLVLRGDLSGDPAFAELLRRSRSAMLDAFEHEDLPFERLVEVLAPERDLSRNPLFQVMLAWQNAPLSELRLPDLAAEPLELGGVASRFDLLLSLDERGGVLEGWLEHSTDLFDAATVQRLGQHFAVLLAGAARNADLRLSRLPLLPDAERQQILVDWNATEVDYPRDTLIHRLVEAQAARTPGAEALVAPAASLSYGALNERANRLARCLRSLGVGPEVRVGVCLERSPDLVVSLLAVLKAGGAYVPLDPDYPRERLAYMVADSGASLVLTQERLLDEVLPQEGVRTFCLDRSRSRVARYAASNLPACELPENLAYVIYTSGSTGRPKGVAIPHRSAVCMLAWSAGIFSRQEIAGLLAATSVSFDLSVFEIFLPLSTGGTVVLADNLIHLATLPAAGRVTLVNTVPSVLTELLRQSGLPAGVRTVNLAGEPLPRDLADRLYALGTVERVVNLYGPSEDTTYSTWAVIDRSPTAPPIGRPAWNTRAYVLDPYGEPVPVGVAGELYLGSDCLARGYLGLPHLTAERFVPDPFGGGGLRLYRTGDLARYRADGNLEFLGRADHQIKLRGFRIELGEIEERLREHPGVVDCAAAVRDVRGERQLVGYVVTSPGVKAAPAELRRFLRDRLPVYMIPALFVALDALPLTPSGKLDRKALPAPGIEPRAMAAGAQAPSRPSEALVAAVWSDVLGTPVGPQDDFFALGGHSLLAMRVIARLRDAFGVEVPVRALFEQPTVAGLARRLEEARLGEPEAAPPPIEPHLQRRGREERAPLSFSQERLWFLDQLEPGSPVYNIAAPLELVGELRADLLAAVFTEIERRHQVLRTVFAADAEGPMQIVHPPAAFALPLVDLSDLGPDRRREEAEALAREEAWRPFDLARGPVWRALLVRLGRQEHRLLLTLHHIAGDGWSLGVLVRETAALYEAFTAVRPSPLPALPVQYDDFAVWQRRWLAGEVLERRLAWWRQRLAGMPPVLELPTDRPRGGALGPLGGVVTLRLRPATAEALEARCLREGATLFMALMAAFQGVLGRLAGQSDFGVGTPVAGRMRPELEGLIGFFVNTLVLRSDLSGDPGFGELLGRVRDSALEAFAHQDLPFERLVEELAPARSLSHTPLFQVLMVLQNTPMELRLPGLGLAVLDPLSEPVQFDLSLSWRQTAGLEGRLSYRSELFDRATAQRIADGLETLLVAVAGGAVEPVSSLSQLSEPLERQVLHRQSTTASEDAAVPEEISPLEELLAGLWCEILGLPQVGRQESFFDLGGHSLMATRLVLRIRSAMGVDLPVRALFEAPSVAAMARRLAQKPATGRRMPPPIVRARVDGPAPLSFAQERLWFLDRFDPGGSAYNLPYFARLRGRLASGALERSLRAILDRHEVLRTRFPEVEGIPVQAVEDAPDFQVHRIDLSALPPEAADVEERRLAGEEARRPFDLSRAPLVRAALLRKSVEENTLLLNVHHIVSDGWSLGLMVAELAQLYPAFLAGGPSPLPPLELQYGDFARWQRKWLDGEVLQEQLAYWKSRLGSDPPPLDLPADRPRPALQSQAGAVVQCSLPPDLVRRAGALARRRDATPFMLLLSAFHALLHRLTGQSEILTGSPIANRQRPEVEGLIGLFVNTLVLRTEIWPESTFSELLSSLRQEALGAYAHQDLPYERLVEGLQVERDPSRPPLFQVMFILQNTPSPAAGLGGLELVPLGTHGGTSKFDLTVALRDEDDTLTVEAEYSTALFDAPTVQRWLGWFERLLAGGVDRPEERVADLPLMDAAEVHQLLSEWSAAPITLEPWLQERHSVQGVALHYVLDPALRPVPPGVPGELFLGLEEPGVAFVGADWVAERFIPDPLRGEPGGRLYRTGDLVRLRPDGRIELLGWVEESRPARLARTRRAGVEPEAQVQEEPATTARGAVEEIVADVWADILGLRSVDPADDFFDLGGHSLLATRVLSRLRAMLGVDVPLREFFAAPTVAGLAARIERKISSDTPPPAPPLRRLSREGSLPLSFAQERLWFLDQLEPASPLYNIPAALRLHGGLDVPAFQAGLGELVRRHESLRTRFPAVQGGAAAVVEPACVPALPLIDLTGLRPVAEQEVLRLAAAEARRPFDLAAGPLLRVALLRLGHAEHVALVNMHHIVSDGWSLGVLVRDLGLSYEAVSAGRAPSLPELPVQYADFAAWQREWLEAGALAVQLGFWSDRLAELPVLELPTDRPRGAVPRTAGGAVPLRLSPELSASLLARGRHEGATLFMLLLAGFEALLGRVSGQADFGVGTPIAGRTHPELEDLIGLFINTLVLRADLSGDPDFGNLLHRVRGTMLEAYAHQDVPFERLVAELSPERSLTHTPLFQVMLTLQNAPVSLHLPGLDLSLLEVRAETAKFDLSVSWIETPHGLAGRLSYRSDLLDRTTAQRLGRSLEAVLGWMASGGSGRLSEIPLLDGPLRHQIVREWGEPAALLGDVTAVPERFERWAARQTGSPAVRFEEESLSYRELEARTRALALRLQRHGVGPDVRVGVYLERSAEAVAALLGVLRSGGAYVPLDPAHPAERVLYQLEDSGARLLLTTHSLLAGLGEVQVESLCLPELWEDPGPGRLPAPLPESLAYVIYTSGSTGRPKGVGVEHRQLASYTSAVAARLGLPAGSVYGLVSTLAADLGHTVVYPSLTTGGCLQVVSRGESQDGEAVGRWFAGGVDCLKVVPSHLSALLASGDPGRILPRSCLVLGGEASSWDLVERVEALAPGCRVLNHYGPTETAVGVTTYAVTSRRQGATVPLGRPLGSARLRLLDRDLAAVGVGTVGELHVGGASVSRGYLGRPEATAERFVPDPFGVEPGARLYRTGDLCRWRSDGALEFLGRADHQVKVRGYRIELGEVESALESCSGVERAVVLVRETDLVGVVVGSADLGELRTALARRLPSPMIPSLVRVESIPLTANGKVDRQALLDLARVEPRDGVEEWGSPVEELLSGLWCEVLGRERIGREESFFEAGGHSLLATRLVSRIRSAFGVEIPVRALFEAPSVSAMARHLGEQSVGEGPPLPAIERGPAGSPAPLSFSQERLWFLDRFEPGSSVYNLPYFARLEGPLEVWALERSLLEILERHEVLRTRFPEESGRPVQVVDPAPGFVLHRIDLSGLPEGLAAREEERLAIEEARRQFDLGRSPLIRASVVVRSAAKHTLLLNLHHIVSDAWSRGVLTSELLRLYPAFAEGRPSPLDPLPVQYGDFARWQRSWLTGEVLEEQLAYWKSRLGPEPPALALPTDRPRPAVQSFAGAVLSSALPVELSSRVRELSRTYGVTPFMVGLAVFHTLLCRLSGQEQILTGSPIANRRRPELEGLIGLFINTLVLGSRFESASSFAEVLLRVRQEALGAYAHQDLPFEKLVEGLRVERSLSRSPLFQALFVLQNAPHPRWDLGGVSLVPVGTHGGTSKFDLTLALVEEEGALRSSLEYASDLFDRTTAHRLLEQFGRLLEESSSRPDLRFLELSLLSVAQRHQTLMEWNPSASVYARESCLHELFEAQVERSPHSVAALFAGESLSYRELNARANRLAWFLGDLGMGGEVRVGVCLDRSLDMLVGVLAVLKAGGAYVPLDPSHPRERLALMVSDAGLGALLASESMRSALEDVGVPVVFVDGSDREAIALQSPPNPVGRACSENLAYVLYTSGSTGRPKGVEVSHRSLVNLLGTMAELSGASGDDHVLALTPLSFDIAGLELFLPLLLGGRVEVVEREVAVDAERLADRLSNPEVTLVQATPSSWRLLLRSGWPGRAGLRALCGGEALEPSLARDLVSRVSALWNVYGPTETTIWSTAARVDGSTVVTIGRPLANTRVYVLDVDLRPQPPGVPGLLYIAGEGVARGYLGRPDLTAERFVPEPGWQGGRMYSTGDLARWLPDGRLEYLGRVDHQVKLRGFRIELGEIESALGSHPGVGESAVVLRSSPAGGRLVAYYVERPGWSVGSEDLRGHLRAHLPEPMLPSSFVALESLPRTPNGKLDRRALPEPTLASAPQRAGSGLELQIAELWRELLGVERVGLEENFFDVGGHSLLVVDLSRRLKESLGETVAVVDLFRHTTVASQAAFLAERLGLQPRTDVSLRPQASPVEERAIAIIGMAGRFPGAGDVESFWHNLVGGVESVSLLSEEELRACGVEPSVFSDPAYVRARGVLEGVEDFDADFFSIPPREAEWMDPQHRLFLECAWHALESAGYEPGRPNGRIGVFASSSINTYIRQLDPESAESPGAYQVMIGNDKDFLPTRVSYKLDLRGPSMSVQTACSSSLVAVHVACQSLLAGECEAALAGGVSVRLPQAGYLYREGMIQSPDGRCRPFDASAGGTVSGNGVGVVVLKPLSRALADGDTIRAVIRGTAINNDGSGKIGYTAPSVEGQSEVILRAQEAAGIRAETIGYVEAHGTGTALGDPIEVTALREAFGRSSSGRGFCALGSVKANLGHLDAAAGVTGLIKAALAVERGVVPPQVNFERAHPELGLEESPFYVPSEARPWEGPRRAGLSSFGIGGTNAHAVLEEPPAAAPSQPSRPWQLLLWSARSETALDALTSDLKRQLEEHPGLDLADLAYTLRVGRRAMAHRRMLVCESRPDAALARWDEVISGSAESPDRPVVFLFPGQGAQAAGMGAELYRSEPVFRETVDLCCELLVPHLGLDLRERLLGSEELRETALAQPALFVVEYALARLWMEWGVRPSALLGHSIGQYVAACLAEVFTLPEALALVAERGRLMQELPTGAMLSVPLPEAEVRALLGPELSLAAVNGPSRSVVSGSAAAVAALSARLAERGVACRALETSHAFHSWMMEPVLARFEAAVSRCSLRGPKLPLLSNVTGMWMSAEEATSPESWARHLREPVLFGPALSRALDDPRAVLLEVGPGRSLASLVRHQARERPVVSSLAGGQPEPASLLGALGRLWLSGVALDDSGFWRNETRRRIPAPLYPFERQRYWLEARKPAESRPSLARRPEIGDWFYLPSWRPSVPPPAPSAVALARESPWLILCDGTGLGESLAGSLRSLGQRAVTVRPSEGFLRLGDDAYAIDPKRAADYESLLGEIPPPGQVVHLWSFGPAAEDPWPARFEQAQSRGLHSLLFLARALSAREVTFHVVTSGVLSVLGEELEPEKATILGPCRVLPQEHPNLAFRHLDLEASGPQPLERLLAELASEHREPTVAWRGARRWIQEFEPVSLPGSPRAGLREGGVYFLTGGLGAIGGALSGMLARTVRAKLVLVGRTPLPGRAQWAEHLAVRGEQDPLSRRIRHVEQLEALGAEVLVLSADIADPAQAREAVERSLERFGTLHGVIHAAGVQSALAAEATGPAECRALLRPKAEGLAALDAALEGIEVDFRILFSSLSSVLGGLGFSAYAAANLFLDAFAWHSHHRGHGRWTSVDWDGWRLERPGAGGFTDFAMTAEEGTEAFRRLLSLAGEPQVVVSTADLAARRKRWVGSQPARTMAAAPAGSSHGRPSLKTPYREPSDTLERSVAEVWSRLLGIAPIGADDDFFELGGDSLLATQMSFELRRSLALELPLQRFFETPTVAGITAAAVADTRDEDLEQLLAEIEGLSPAEIQALLPAEHPLPQETE